MFHVAHLRAHIHGGPLVEENTAAWCVRCNLENGSTDASDPRLIPRDWQLQALPKIVRRIREDGAATLSAAPGAGKTVFAGLVFEHLRELDLVDRMVVLAPNRIIVSQWSSSLAKSRHIELRPFHELERRSTGQLGVVVTYQSLNPETVFNHRTQAERLRTLLVLDEVHHVGEPVGDNAMARPAWARYVTELAGTLDGDLHVAGVLNLSGTLWRSDPSERISTVRYKQLPDGRLESLVDWEVPVEQLIGSGELRPVDLFRLGAQVRVADWNALAVIDSGVADLDAKPARAAIAGLPKIDEWRDAFVTAVIDRLEQAWRSLDKQVPVKALIVASRQADAKLFHETANRVMTDRGLKPIAEIAVSDDKHAAQTLERFRRSSKVGVLSTVGMAGEGYDCPEIVVVGFASNRLTPLHVRQVVARAQRVTAHEGKQGRPIPAAVVLPDAQQLVQVMSEILAPMHHEIAARPDIGDRDQDGTPYDDPQEESGGRLMLPAFVLEDATVNEERTVRVTGVEDGDIDYALVSRLEPALEEAKLRPSDAARVIWAIRKSTNDLRDARPFDPLSVAEQDIETFGEASRTGGTPTATAVMDGPSREPMTEEHEAQRIERGLARLGKWWAVHGDTDVKNFVADMNRAGGIPTSGGRSMATVAQLHTAFDYGRKTAGLCARRKGIPEPRTDIST